MTDPLAPYHSPLTTYLSPLTTHHSSLDRVDPRARIVAAAAFSAVVAVARGFPTLGLALGAAVLAAMLARLRPAAVVKRLAPVNLFMLFLFATLPWALRGAARAVEGGTLFQLGPFEYTWNGLRLAAAIGLKANAIVLALVVLLGTMDVTTMGHALSHLHVPDKLTHLLLFTVRYLDVLRREYLRLRAAMKLRGFRPQMNLHTYRSYGYLVGMLLVVSLDRSERIVAAMKCRGFRGRFYLLDHFAFSRRDAWFGLVSSALLALLVALSVVGW